MRLMLLIISFFWSSCLFSQSIFAKYYQNRCEFQTDGSGNSLGMKIKLSVPCDWKAQDGDRPNTIKKFSVGLGDTSIGSIVMVIKKMEGSITKEDLKILTSRASLLEMYKESCDTIISAKQTIIDGIHCGEVIYRLDTERASILLSLYTISYQFFYKDKSILINYSIGSTQRSNYEKHIKDFTLFARGLALNTVIINQWK